MKKMFKRALPLFLAVIMLVGILAGCGSQNATQTPGASSTPNSSDEPNASETPNESDKLSMAMITDAGGLGDKGFNDLVWQGMNKAKDELGFEINAIESTEAAQYGPNIAAAAEQGFDIVVCVGFLFVDVLAEVAPKYPDTKFVMIDGEVAGDNVYSYVFDVQESSYLAGALAGLVADTNKFGYVGGMEIPVVIAWESGYISGIKTTRPDAEVMTAYVGSFADPGKAKELALTQFNKGAAACLEVSSGGAIGVVEAARDANKKFIASDGSKDDLAPGFEMTAALCKRDEAVFAVAKMIKEGTAKPGTTHLSLKDGIFGLPEYTEELYGSDVTAKIEKLYSMILSGEIVIPTTREEVASFTYPEF